MARKRTGYGMPVKIFTIGLGCELRHAHHLVYSHGLDLDEKTFATSIGMVCKISELTNCPQNAFPPVDRKLEIDGRESTFAP